jgi:C4-type Zn-finger protein
MKLASSILLVSLLGIVVYLLSGWWANHSIKSHREDCPNCSKDTLQIVNFLKATILINGRRAPDSYMILECSHCGYRYRKSKGQQGLESIKENEEF